ncbi:MAG TPA: PP2C family serine/threonine-protein phosphatase [Kofleriaceae bacterium]|nr:PP2C family serine/threonine-protein phosphatase [Kofleriaceae bacterium]
MATPTKKGTGLEVSAAGDSHAGHVRQKNEDCFLSEPQIGLFAVFDGMGGHSAGDIASARARDVVRAEVFAHRERKEPRALIDEAIRAASAAVHNEARKNRELTGMGTTVVACYRWTEARALVAHVGDSRAYQLRGGRMRPLTRDHTVVAELVARNALSPADAAVHPYKSVLSRNLGGKADAKVDLIEVDLEPGDRLLLCSDGLNGFASHEAMEQVLAGSETASSAAADLIELALRGGGGDNVTALVIDCGREAVAESTQQLRKSAALEWWTRRDLFRREARARKVHESPICSVLSPSEAIAIVAGNLCESVYHDLEQAAGVHVWTFAENLANGWLDQGGAYDVLRDLLDRLRASAEAVITDVALADPRLAVALEIDVVRSLIVAEMAVAGALGERMRRVEEVLVEQHTRESTAPTFHDEKTIPFTSMQKVEPPTPLVATALERARAAAIGTMVPPPRSAAPSAKEPTAPQAMACLEAAHKAALEAGDMDPLPLMRELFGSRHLTEVALRPLIDSLDAARQAHIDAVRALRDEEVIVAAAARRVAAAHQGLMTALALLCAESAQSVTDGYRAATVRTSRLRAEVGHNEARMSRLERELAVGGSGGSPATSQSGAFTAATVPGRASKAPPPLTAQSPHPKPDLKLKPRPKG